MTRFRRIGESERYRGTRISVGTARFVSPSGQEFERDVVHHETAVAMVALTADRTVLLVRQYRGAVDRELLEIPAGLCDVPDEPFETTAARELAEEIGMTAGRMERLCDFYNAPGACDHHTIVFLARDLEACPNDLQGIEEQHMTVEQIALDDVPALVVAGDIVDAKTIIGLLLARDASA